MKIPEALVLALRRRVLNHMAKYPPTRIIHNVAGTPYLHRWELRGNHPAFDIYLHRFLTSDDQELHDHPAVSIAVVLSRRYTEWFQFNKHKMRSEGDIIVRRAATAHRIEIDDGGPPPVTIFLRGPKMREWGFYSGGTWWHHRDFPRHPL